MGEKVETGKPVLLGIMFAGGCGTNNALEVMKLLDISAYPHLRILVCNTDRRQLDRYFSNPPEDETEETAHLHAWIQSDQLKIVQLGDTGMGAGGKPEEGAKATEAKINEIEQFLEIVDTVLLIGGAGKGTGSGALPVMAEAASKAGKQPMAIVTMPRLNEGGKRIKKAIECRQKLLRICPTIVVYNEQMPEVNVIYTEVWSRINKSCLLPILLVLQEIILEVADLNLDLNDWRSFLETGNFLQFGLCEMSSDNSPDFSGVANELLNNPYQDCKIMSNAREILLWLHGPWTVAEHGKIIEFIQAKMSIGIKDDSVEINSGVFHSTLDGQKWVGMLAVAKEPPSDPSDEDDSNTSNRVVDDSRVVELPPASTLHIKEQPVLSVPTATNGLKEISCSIDGRASVLMVSHEVADEWNRVSTSLFPKGAEVIKVIDKIRGETGKVVGMPTKLHWKSNPNGREKEKAL